MARYPIPAEALDDRLAILGTAGSGKTYLTLGAIEKLLAVGARVVAVDPLGVMWGLRLKADGKTASGFSIPIFGGRHGDLPLNEHAGALIGETVASMRESCIVDLSELPTKAAERRFMTAFLEAIYRHTDPNKQDPYHLVLDEADRFAPQKPPAGDETMLNRMEEIVRRGRVKGFIPWLITQRPAVLNKNVLSQADGLVMLKLTSSQDRDQVGAWIEGQADRAQGRAILGSLPAMQRGQGVVWIPGRGILETVQFPAKTTFDSSAAPKRGQKRDQGASLKPLDLGALKERLATVEAETKANDPAALKRQLAAANVELVKLRKLPATSNEGPKINTADQKAAERALAAAREEGAQAIRDRIPDVLDAQHQASFKAGFEFLATRRAVFEPELVPARRPILAIGSAILAKVPQSTFVPPSVTKAAPASSSGRTPDFGSGNRGSTPRAGTSELPRPQQRILNSLATWAEMGHATPANAQVAWLAGYSPNSTSYTNPRSALKTAGLIEYPSGDLVALTDDGHAKSAPISIPGTLLDFVLAQLKGPEARILKAAADMYPRGGTNEEIAEAANYSASSTSYTNPRSALKTKDLITYPSGGQVRAADWLFP